MKTATGVAALVMALGAALPAAEPAAERAADAAAEVRERERAFAKTMADRNLDAFASFLSKEAIFMGGAGALRGRDAVVGEWKKFYDGEKAPFSWEPETVEVVDSGGLALSRGPVFAPDGKRIGTFTSTWRKEADGRWMIVLDSGCPPCPACP
jgi:ketosteroid isomerase-like protein